MRTRNKDLCLFSKPNGKLSSVWAPLNTVDLLRQASAPRVVLVNQTAVCSAPEKDRFVSSKPGHNVTFRICGYAYEGRFRCNIALRIRGEVLYVGIKQRALLPQLMQASINDLFSL